MKNEYNEKKEITFSDLQIFNQMNDSIFNSIINAEEKAFDSRRILSKIDTDVLNSILSDQIQSIQTSVRYQKFQLNEIMNSLKS